MIKRLYFILYATLLPLTYIYPFFDNNITLLTTQNGLSDNSVSCIYKDPDNFMWFGTDNGLNRYDGKNIRSFNFNTSEMAISEIKGVSDPYLAVISDEQLYYFDRKRECFVPVYHASDHSPVHILHLLPDISPNFWGLSNNRLILYQYHEIKNQTNEVIEIQLSILKEKFFFKDNKQESFSGFCYIDVLNKLGLITNRGQLLLINPQSFEQSDPITLANNFSSLIINSIYSDKYSIWLSTTQYGIFRYHFSTKKIEHITYEDPPKEIQLSHTDAFQVTQISEKQYIAVTWSGYTIFTCDEQTHEISRTYVYKTFPPAYQNVETRMLCVYFDRYGKLWIGTNGGGVIHIGLQALYQQYYQEKHNEICGIIIDNEQYIWLATYHKGIMKSKTPFEKYHIPDFNSIGPKAVRSKHTVLCISKEPSGKLWFGNYDGTLTSYQPETKQFMVHTISDGKRELKSPIWALYPDTSQHIWIGTEKGLYRYNTQSGSSRRLPIEKFMNNENIKDLLIRNIVSTKDGDIWLGTSNAGICRLKMTSEQEISSVRFGYESEAGINQCSTRSLITSTDGTLYAGYTNGFATLSPIHDSIQNYYTTQNGLCSNFIGAIVEDSKNRIWLGSNSGISRYSRHQHLFYNYYIVGSNRSALSHNGILFWGNNRSLTYYNPDDLCSYVSEDKVKIIRLEINNKTVSINESIHEQTILKEGISYIDSLVLANNNRDFALTFNNLSYSQDQQKYNYRLLPYQKDWIISDENAKAVYTNLPHGDYLFEVKSIFPDGHSGQVTNLKIKILPHWSQTFLFRLAITICFLGVLGYVFILIRKRQKRIEHEMQMKHELYNLNLEREKEYQIRTERENFFTTVAHELRTPLMLIISPLQELLQQLRPSDTLYNRLSIMYKNGASLSTLVDHLLYVQKINAGMIKLQLSKTDITSLTRDLTESFRPTSEIKGFRFDVKLPDTPLYLWIDAPKIIMAIRNLLSNAFKYTPTGGSIIINVSSIKYDYKEFVEIEISDTGIGIPIELQNKIFDSFITGNTDPSFSTKIGIGLYIVKNTINLHHGEVKLHSIPAKGSTFTLSIPKGTEHFAEDSYEYISEPQIEKNPAIISTEAFAGVSSSPENTENKTSKKKNILIIEDNEEVRHYIQSLFIRKYTVYQAENGEEGIRMASELIPDLIISDVMMPVKDGMTCCHEIRNLQKTAHIPILMLTAKAEDSDIIHGYHNGVDEYLLKPFNPAILVAKAENLILQRERLKRIYTKALMIKENASEENKENPLLQQVLNVIELNLSDPNFNVKALAKQMNMSQPTLYRHMKSVSELAVIDIIRSVRISKAASLLMENRFSIQEITEMVGYSDTRTLRKHFTEQLGISPSKYIDKKENEKRATLS